jgi:hypothetical protein
MIPAVITSSTQAAQRRLSFYIALNLASVLAPGIVIVIAATFLIEPVSGPSSPLVSLTHLKNYSGAAAFVVSIALVAAGYVFGYVSRELAFKLLRQFEKIPRIQARVSEGVNARLRSYFTPGLINDCLQVHRVLSEMPEGSTGPARIGGAMGGGHSDSVSYKDFTYAKLWIRNYAAGFSIDSVEAEINILVSGLIPTLLSAAAIIAASKATWPSIVGAVIFLGLTWSVLLDSIFRLRHTEKWEAVRNLIMDYAMREASNKLSPGPEAEEAQPE